MRSSSPQIVSWIGRDDQHALAHAAQRNCQRAARCRFADAAFATDENPLQRLLIDDVSKRGLDSAFIASCRLDISFVSGTRHFQLALEIENS